MNKLSTTILALASMLSFCGCINEPLVQEASKDSAVRIYADFAETKTNHTSENGVTSVSWVKGDNIGISTDNQINLHYTANSSAKATDFSAFSSKLQASEGDKVYAYYPYMFQDDHKKASIPLENTQGQFSSRGMSGYDVLYAEGQVINNEVSLKFKHIYSFLRVTVSTSLLVKDDDTGKHILRLISNEPFSILDGRFNIETKEFEMDYTTDVLYIIEEDITGKESVTCDIAMLPQSGSARVSIYSWANNFSVENLLYTVSAPKDGLQAGKIYTLNLSDKLLAEEREKSIAALTALYNSTNGDQWHKNTNWLSDEPIYNWYGLNHNYWEGCTIETDEIVEIQLFDNNLRGTLPVEFTHIMSKALDIMIDGNGLYGVIPEEVRTHSRWNEFGWNVILQSPYIGGGFDMTDINLRASDMEVEYLKGGTARLADLLKANKISLIMIDTPSDELANLFLSYKNKGFGIIISHSGAGGESREATIERTDKYALTDGIVRLWEMHHPQLGEGLGWLGTVFLLDEDGNLIDVLPRDWAISESWYCSKIGERLQEHLGDPEEHPEFSTEYYTSTDYSRDGEVITMQTATNGKGIDIVFMGDGYVDKQMDDDGKYEQDMRASMEYFFEVEPYKSFRDRFNVYAVKVISPNEEKEEGCQWRLNYDNALCFEYASEVPGINLNKATVVNVTNSPNLFFISGYTNMYEGGASIAHIEQGGPSSIIVHEAGGHGFGKLLDEYIYSGYEDNYCPPENLESFKEWIRTDYHNKGWGVNIDTTDDPEKVIWSHFLKDERYEGEVGIWQGAWYWPTDLWRASENSVMNSDYSYFNAPSREAIYKWIMQWSEGEGWEYDYEKFVEYDAINRSSVLTRSNYVIRQDNRKVNHCPPVIINGSPKANAAKDENLSRYISR